MDLECAPHRRPRGGCGVFADADLEALVAAVSATGDDELLALDRS